MLIMLDVDYLYSLELVIMRDIIRFESDGLGFMWIFNGCT